MQNNRRSVPISHESGKQTEQKFLTLYKGLFLKAVGWNIFESILYQLIFITHQIGLFTYCDRWLYGKAGVFFSFSYLSVTILLVGLDGGLLPFFKDFIADQKSFLHLFIVYIKKQVFFIALCCVVGGLSFSLLSSSCFTVSTVLLVAVFIFVEAVKKILKHILYLSFYNRYAALLEVAQIGLYVTCIWMLYARGYLFSISLFFIPFIILSTIFCLFSLWFLKMYYQTLPACAEGFTTLPSVHFFRQVRIAVLINQLCRSLFTSNFLVPLFSAYEGFSQAGVMTFANYLTHSCTFFMYKICIPPAEAFLARVRYFSLDSRFHVFKTIFIFFISLVVFIAAVVCYKGKTLAIEIGCTSLTHVTWTLFLFFFFIHILENIFLLYEKFFLLHDKVALLATANLITCAVCVLISFWCNSFGMTVALCIGIRFLLFLLLSFLIILSKPSFRAAFKHSFSGFRLLNIFYKQHIKRQDR